LWAENSISTPCSIAASLTVWISRTRASQIDRVSLPGFLDRDAFGQGVAADGAAETGDRAAHRRVGIGLHAVDDDVGALRRDRRGDAGDQAAAADRGDHRIDLGAVFQDFQADGALAGNHQRIVEGVDQGQILFRGVGQGEFLGLAVAFAGTQYRRAQRFGALDLGHRRAHRHHDGGGDAQLSGMPGDALRVISGGHRDHPGAARLRRQADQLDQRAARLEGAGELQVLELQADVDAGHLGKSRGGDQGGAHHVAPQHPCAWRMVSRVTGRFIDAGPPGSARPPLRRRSR
jgi:hypothetical protein